MRTPCRTRVHACIHPETYKYFLRPAEVDEVWRRIAETYGEVRHDTVLPLLHVESGHLLLRAPVGGNPITVIRQDGCTESDIRTLHAVLRFDEE